MERRRESPASFAIDGPHTEIRYAYLRGRYVEKRKANKWTFGRQIFAKLIKLTLDYTHWHANLPDVTLRGDNLWTHRPIFRAIDGVERMII